MEVRGEKGVGSKCTRR